MKIYNRKLAKRVAINELNLGVLRSAVVCGADFSKRILDLERSIAADLRTLAYYGYDKQGNKLPEVPKYRLGRCVAHQECGCKICHKAKRDANS